MADPGELIAGRYRLVNRIAVGGMGVVWEGWDELLARRVAVKQLLTQPGLSEADAMLARNRVIREARITARLHHPHAVTIYDVVDHGDSPCLIMQFVPSDSLSTLLRERGTLTPAAVGRIGADLASALQAAHAVGIVHRDVKPGNVLITDDGSAKLTDFGISHANGDVTLTSTGMVSGTPAYLAPEVARGGDSGYAADVFSLGATLYASTEGSPPFGVDTNPMAVLHRVASGQMIPPQRSGPLTPLLLRMMAPNPADRPTMSEVSRTLTLPQFAAPSGPAPGAHPGSGSGSAPVERPAAQTLPVSRGELSEALASGPEPAAKPPAEDSDSPDAEPTNEPAALAALMAPKTRTVAPAPTGGGSRRQIGALVAAVVLIAVVAVGFLLLRDDEAEQQPVAATTVQETPASSADPAAQSSEPAARSEPLSATSEPPSATSNPPSASASEPVTGEPTSAALSAAVTDYYAQMPGNTDAGWASLTPAFQSGIAQDREYYNSFWSGVERVEVANPVGTPPGTVEATVTYYFADGSVSVEDTVYELVDDGGVLKINNSTVLTSRSG